MILDIRFEEIWDKTENRHEAELHFVILPNDHILWLKSRSRTPLRFFTEWSHTGIEIKQETINDLHWIFMTEIKQETVIDYINTEQLSSLDYRYTERSHTCDWKNKAKSIKSIEQKAIM